VRLFAEYRCKPAALGSTRALPVRIPPGRLCICWLPSVNLATNLPLTLDRDCRRQHRSFRRARTTQRSFPLCSSNATGQSVSFVLSCRLTGAWGDVVAICGRQSFKGEASLILWRDGLCPDAIWVRVLVHLSSGVRRRYSRILAQTLAQATHSRGLSIRRRTDAGQTLV
jgi:hypothetical protein